MAHFESNIAESDAYLSMLIEQVKQLEERRESLTSDDEIKKINGIIDSTKV